MSNAAYEKVTAAILARLEKGLIPWRRPWTLNGAPKNLVSKKQYRGINPFILGTTEHTSPWWVTYRQAKQLGGNVRRGEKGTQIIFWRIIDKDGENGQDGRRFAMLRYYTVFNADQCDGLEKRIPQPAEKPREFTPIQQCERIAAGYNAGPNVKHGGDRAYYRPSADRVGMPARESFETPEHYYSTLFHELGHSTGHKDRLNRDGIQDLAAFDTHEYSKEELVAEMTAAMLSGVAGIDRDTVENSAAYIDNWRRKIGEDPRLVVQAAAAAQKASDHILGDSAKDDDHDAE